MRARSMIASVAVVTAVLPAITHATSDLLVSPRAEVVHAEFSGGYSGRISGIAFDNAYDVSLQALRVGLSVGYRGFYIDGYYQQTNKDSDNLLFGPTNYRYESERNESTFTTGYRLSDTTTLFAGIRQSSSETEASQGNRIDLDTDAYFFGGGLNFPVLEKAVVTFNAAYVYIDSVDYKVSDTDLQSTSKLDGDGNGWKLGVAWTGAFTNKLQYTLGADYFSYDWDADNRSGEVIRADEDELFLRAGISYLF